MTGFEPVTSFDTGPQLPAPSTTWNTCVGQIAQKRHFPGENQRSIFFVFFAVDDLDAFYPNAAVIFLLE